MDDVTGGPFRITTTIDGRHSMSNSSSYDPFWLFQWPLSGPVNQRITTPWFSPSYTVNYVGNPTIEHRVVSEVASYGRQLGWLGEIVLALVNHTEPPSESVEQLQRASREIEKIKKDVQRSALEEANKALDRLKREQPKEYERLLRARRG
jgi:hypothetical protein